MKNKIAAACLAFLVGCALFKGMTTEQKIYRLTYAAASIGTSDTLVFKPAWSNQFYLAYTQLDQQITHSNLTGQSIRDIFLSLPVKELRSPQAVIAVQNATFLFDTLTGGQFNVETNLPIIWAFGTGFHDGIGTALHLR